MACKYSQGYQTLTVCKYSQDYQTLTVLSIHKITKP